VACTGDVAKPDFATASSRPPSTPSAIATFVVNNAGYTWDSVIQK